jgi:hypothetical protein
MGTAAAVASPAGQARRRENATPDNTHAADDGLASTRRARWFEALDLRPFTAVEPVPA